jgi:hypothetical protein
MQYSMLITAPSAFHELISAHKFSQGIRDLPG